jgi:isopenicillin N synthase-like dioxygenase
MLPTARKLAFNNVPVVDLAPAWSGDAAARRKLADEIADVCGRVGFFYIKNHGLSDADVAAIFKTSADFHNLPLEAKMEVSITKNNHAQGYLHGMSKGNEKSLSENLQEAFQIKRPLADDDPDLLAGKPLHGKIPWPSAMPDLKPRMMAYYDKVNALGYELLALFELALGLREGELKQYFKKDMNSLRLLHYPPQKPDEDGVHLGARAHTDTNAFTILAQDNNGGLEVRNRDNDWVAVPPIDGTLVVNVGEVLKVWSDGIFSSTLHRVINRSGRRRYSVPFFMYPSYDALIHPLLKNPDPSNVAPENLHTSMPRDKPFIYGEFKSRHTAKIMPGQVKVPT